MQHEFHGGECCGMCHLHRFGTPNKEQLLRDIESAVDETYCDSGRVSDFEEDDENCFPMSKFNHLVECVLTDGQLDSGWRDILKEVGFKKKTRFFNSNSGNYCTVFHYQHAPGRKGK